MTSLHPHRVAAIAIVIATTVALGGCSGAPPAASVPPSPSSPPSTSPPASAAPTAPLDVDGVVGGQAALAGTRIAVQGFLLIEPNGMRMCAVVLESYPPQCGGGSILIQGTVPDDVRAQLTSTENEPDLHQAAWGDVVVTGTLTLVDGGTPTLAMDGISVVAPE
ncbi:MAG TPA: hypothetical protein VH813_05270 [Candidatus Limnocylindrales bacterium]|jgi:hypothetical protein